MINFNHLRAFFCVAKHRSFTLACKELNVSQPAISRHVQNLEKQFANPLLIRKGKQIELTDEGQMIYSYGERIFALAGNLEKNVNESNSLHMGEIKIGATLLTVKDLAPKIIHNLKNRYPDIKIQLFTLTAKEILDKVINSEFHVGIMAGMAYPDVVAYQHLQREKLFFITTNERIEKKIFLKALSNCPIILPMEGAVYREIVINEFKKRDTSLNIFIEAADPAAIKSMVSKGLGGSFLPLDAIEKDAQDGKFRIVEILDDLHFYFDILYLNERRESKAIKSILSAMNLPWQ